MKVNGGKLAIYFPPSQTSESICLLCYVYVKLFCNPAGRFVYNPLELHNNPPMWKFNYLSFYCLKCINFGNKMTIYIIDESKKNIKLSLL